MKALNQSLFRHGCLLLVDFVVREISHPQNQRRDSLILDACLMRFSMVRCFYVRNGCLFFFNTMKWVQMLRPPKMHHIPPNVDLDTICTVTTREMNVRNSSLAKHSSKSLFHFK